MSVTTYSPNYVTRETNAEGQVVVKFVHKHHFTSDQVASGQVEGFKAFVADLHKQGYVAASHLSSQASKSGYYNYSQAFQKKG